MKQPTNPTKMPDFVYNQMLEGLQKMLVLRLQGAPPADTITALAAVWEEALTPLTCHFDDRDRERLPTAFRLLIQQADKWQQPAQLIKLIPPRAEQPIAGLLENKKTINEFERARNKLRLQQILTRLAQAKTLKEKP